MIKYITRKGYYRKGYTKKTGIKVKGAYIKPTKIKDLGKPGHGINVIGRLRKGDLTKYGYHLTKSAILRHRALLKASHVYGKSSVIKKVNALSVLFKNTHPALSTRAKSDVRWLE